MQDARVSFRERTSDVSDTTTTEQEELPTRRDFIYVATGMMGVFGAASVAWPFIDQMNPDAAVLAAGQPIEVNLESMEPGQVITVTWRGKPYFVRRLTEDELTAASDLGERRAVASNGGRPGAEPAPVPSPFRTCSGLARRSGRPAACAPRRSRPMRDRSGPLRRACAASP